MKNTGIYVLVVSVLLAASCLTGCFSNFPGFLASQAVPTSIPTLAAPEDITDAGTADDVPQAEGGTQPTQGAPFISSTWQLTQTGCCTEAFWSVDGREVRFIDRPSPSEPTGVYGVSIEGGAVELVTEEIGFPALNGQYFLYPNRNNSIRVVEVDTGEEFSIATDADRVAISPSGTRIAWARSPSASSNFDQRPAAIHVANIDGSDERQVFNLVGGGFGGWVDDETLLVAGVQVGDIRQAGMYALWLPDGSLTELAKGRRVRSVEIAPGGDWIFYAVTLSGGEAGAEDGLWVVSRDGQARYKLDQFGSAKWRNEKHLLIIPVELGAESNRIIQFDATTGTTTEIINPIDTPFKIAQGDWSISPTGDHIVYLSAVDRSLWVLNLPPIPEAEEQ